MDHPLRSIVSHWQSKIKLAVDYKRKKFQDDADEAMGFYSGPHHFMYQGKHLSGTGLSVDPEASVPRPTFRMTTNKVAEMVQLFGPVLYHRNPVRQVNPRRVPVPPIELFGNPQDPIVQQGYLAFSEQARGARAVDKTRAVLIEHYLNYTPTELGLKDHSRDAIDEALIKGMGVLWTELYYPKGANMKMAGSFYDSVDNLLIDPDAETLADAKWIAKRCVHPVWQVEREYQLRQGELRGNVESYDQQAALADDANGSYNRKRGLTNDLLVYWKIWSKMGIGARLSGVTGTIRETLDTFGDYCYLVICDSAMYPLNLPPHIQEKPGADQDVLARIEWPTPFWADDEWPFTPIYFHSIPRCVWPMSHVKPGLGELKFINWVYSFVASKIRTTCRDFVVVKKGASEEIKRTILSGQDLELLEIDAEHGTISEVVQFLQHPHMQGDIFKVLQAIEYNFEKRVGLTELAYGMSTRQLRSASEAEIKGDQIKVRPDDMAQKVEDAMTAVARKEAITARWHLSAEDVLPSMGPIGAQYWAQLVMTAQPHEIFHQLEYRIEAGSARKPNRDRDAANMTQAIQTIFQPLWQYAMQLGDFGPVNKLIADWAKSIELDPEGYLLKPQPPPPPMPMPPPEGQQPPGAQAQQGGT